MNLREAIDSVPFGRCDGCQADHEFPNLKCDLLLAKAKPGSFVSIAFDSGRIWEQARIIRHLQEDAVIITGLPVEWLERVVRIVEGKD